jgi:hypothetical protein
MLRCHGCVYWLRRAEVHLDRHRAVDSFAGASALGAQVKYRNGVPQSAKRVATAPPCLVPRP